MAINRFQCLSIAQVIRIVGYSPKNYPNVSARLTEMFKDKWVDYGMLPHESALGGITKLYVLAPAGREELRLLGEEIISDRTPFDSSRLAGKGEKPKKLSEYWRHVMHSNDFLITAHQWKPPEVTFRRMLTEMDIHSLKKEYPVSVTLGDGTKTGVQPDGLLEVVHEQHGGFRFVIELEHDNYEESAFRKKVRAYTVFATGPAEKLYGTSTLTVLFLATRGEEHRKKLLKWIAMELRELGKPDYWYLFCVTGVAPTDLSLFTEPVWNVPAVEPGYGDYEPRYLFD
jgi:hypothetical protein